MGSVFFVCNLFVIFVLGMGILVFIVIDNKFLVVCYYSIKYFELFLLRNEIFGVYF